MIEGIPAGAFAQFGPGGLVALFVILVAVGRLVPRRTYDDKVHEANEWRTESRIKDEQIAKKDEQIAEQNKQLGHLEQVGHIVAQLVHGIEAQARKGGDGS